MQITPQMVKELREKTGAGMMDCKKALTEAGNMEAAIQYLREKGLAAAAKKAGRVAAEGLVAVLVKDQVAAMCELNCETDFVARNTEFQTLIGQLCEQAAVTPTTQFDKNGVVDGAELGNRPFVKDEAKTIEAVLQDKILTIGEKISLRRMAHLEGGDAYGCYVHGGGSIGVIVELRLADASKSHAEPVKALARDLAMHIAASHPLCVERSQLDQKIVENERAIFRQQVLDQGKPENIVPRIVDGKIEKFYSEVCLLEQAFVKDPDTSISKLIESVSKDVQCKISVGRFVRFKVGEGIEKKVDDFAQEVARMTGM